MTVSVNTNPEITHCIFVSLLSGSDEVYVANVKENIFCKKRLNTKMLWKISLLFYVTGIILIRGRNIMFVIYK